MPRYCWQCPICSERREVTRFIKDRNIPETCGCGILMDRSFIGELNSVRGDYNDPIVSDSMAFDAIDLAEHRKRFPNIEIVVDHARSARPVFKSLSQKRGYLKARGFIDANSFTG